MIEMIALTVSILIHAALQPVTLRPKKKKKKNVYTGIKS